ncbi:MAG: hypothetical protein ACYSWU_24155, partial [Planctomycetota bacterium]
MMLSRLLATLSLFFALTAFASADPPQDVAPPPNAPATAEWNAAKGELTLEYHGSRILTATVTAKDADGTSVAVKFDSKADTVEEK